MIGFKNTIEEWVADNPVLKQGEFGVEVDAQRFKVGDGFTPWNQLLYSSINKHLDDGASDSVYNPSLFSEGGDSISTYSYFQIIDQGPSYQKNI